MTVPLRLHYAPDNASLCVRLALETLQVPYQTVLVDRRAGGHRTAAYLALNPNGLIPVLETAEGPLFETGAILLHLSEVHGGLMPPVGAPGRGAAVQWLVWLANTLHPALRMHFYPGHYADGPCPGMEARTMARLAALLGLLEDANPAFLSAGPTAQGCYLAPMLRWAALYGRDQTWFVLARTPRLLAFAEAAEAWPAARICARQEGLGPRCFSAPQLPQPPEGSAT